ncbi:MAG TPA: hypothetical protein VEL05_05395 [Candidatus Acidoferrum sp.]|nr:hypothetical protein [Candidatus Acidoferrum sp.]
MPLACYVHPRSSADDRCVRCRRAICPSCVVADGRVALCRSCAQAVARERNRRRLILASLLLVAVGSLLALLALGRAGG